MKKLIDEKQLREIVIQPTLTAMGAGMYSKSVEDLLVGTCAIESRGGTYVRQIEGPAMGIFQMEPATHEDIWRKWLSSYPGMLTKFMRFCLLPVSKPPPEMMIYHLGYACGMARILYARTRKDIPNTLEGHARFYKEHWNTELGKSTEKEYIDAYQSYTRSTGKSKGK